MICHGTELAIFSFFLITELDGVNKDWLGKDNCQLRNLAGFFFFLFFECQTMLNFVLKRFYFVC